MLAKNSNYFNNILLRRAIYLIFKNKNFHQYNLFRDKRQLFKNVSVEVDFKNEKISPQILFKAANFCLVMKVALKLLIWWHMCETTFGKTFFMTIFSLPVPAAGFEPSNSGIWVKCLPLCYRAQRTKSYLSKVMGLVADIAVS
jgi:hypothetical protein